nr:MAG TPA: hypothetical protein [Caudoviricetes sp.]
MLPHDRNLTAIVLTKGVVTNYNTIATLNVVLSNPSGEVGLLMQLHFPP